MILRRGKRTPLLLHLHSYLPKGGKREKKTALQGVWVKITDYSMLRVVV